MTQTLILTVGGSLEPLIAAIEFHRPSQVIAVVSEKDPQTEKAGSYIQLKELAEKSKLPLAAFEELRVPTDNLDVVFQRCLERLERATEPVAIDYSGGTKSMSAGVMLAAAALPEKVAHVTVVAGPRRDLVKVTIGSEAQPVVLESVRDRDRHRLAQNHLATFAYRSAEAALEGAQKTSLKRVRNLCRGFAAWDANDYAGALTQLQGFDSFVAQWLPALRQLAHDSRGASATDRSHLLTADPVRHALVIRDLAHAAERRAEAHRYDDAVLLYYRALEAVAQWILRHEHGIDASAVTEEQNGRLGGYATETDRGVLVLGSARAWSAIAHLNPTGAIREMVEPMQSGSGKQLAHLRNQSILAHGYIPLGRAELDQIQGLASSVLATFESFVGAKRFENNKRVPRLPQLPRGEILDSPEQSR